MESATIPSARVDAAVVRAALDAIVSIDAEGRILEFDPAAQRMFGYEREAAIGAEMADLIIPPALRDAHRAGLRRLREGGESRLLHRRIELEAQRADGSTFPIELAITRIAGAEAAYTGFVRDITDHKLVERTRAERAARQALVVALGQSALAGLDPADLCAAGLSTLAEGFGADRGIALTVDADVLRLESAIGLGPVAGHGEPGGVAHASLLARTLDAGGWLLLTGAELRDAGGLDVADGMDHLLAVALKGPRGDPAGMLAVATTGTGAISFDEGFALAIAQTVATAMARWHADATLTSFAMRDPLTGMANRPLFENRVEQALARARREHVDAAVLFVDVDGFAALNEAYGYSIGDEILVGVGARLAGSLPADATVARLAGDDFAVLIHDVASDRAAVAIGERICSALRKPMLAGGRDLSLTVSIGAVLTGRGTATASEVVRTATVAATSARRHGGSRVEFATQGMRRRLLHAAEIAQGLRRALTDGELRLHYQPILDLPSGKVRAVEALVRWQHPEHGLLAPGQFVAAADASGLAVPLGAEILSIACKELARWQAELDPVDLPAVHVNVSPRQFAAPGLAASVTRTLQISGLRPDRLVLEVTETMVTGEEVALAQLEDLRSAGVQIALDQFGTGHSSLAAIRQLPFDALKVDVAFVASSGEDSRDLRLFAAMVELGRSLGLPITAAKVETEQQLLVLRTLDIDRVQGELFAAALTAGAMFEFVRSGNPWTQLLEATRPRTVENPPGTRAVPASNATAATLLSLGQAARALRISTTTARRWADEGRLGTTRTAGGHRRFPVTEVRRLLAERGYPSIAATEFPKRALPGVAALVAEHGTAIIQMSWRGLYGDLRLGYFVDAEGTIAAEEWSAALASATQTGNYEMLDVATSALMRGAEAAGTSLLERHVALERFGETVTRALLRRSCPRDEVVAARRLFAALGQRQLAVAG